MTWDSLPHGTNGLVLGYGLTFFALLVTLIQQRAAARLIFMSPVVALPCALAGAVAASAVGHVINTRATPTSPWTAPLLSVAVLLFAGFAGGMLFNRRRELTDAHKRGTVIEPNRRATPPRLGTVTLAGVEIPAVDQTKHFKLLGTTGSGKSTAIRELLAGALERGDRAVIADPDGAYLASFYAGIAGM